MMIIVIIIIGLTCTVESFTVKPETCIKKVNSVNMDFTLTLKAHPHTLSDIT